MGGLQQLDNCVSHGFGEVIDLNNLYFLFSSPSIGSLLVVSSLDTVTRCWTRLGSAPIHWGQGGGSSGWAGAGQSGPGLRGGRSWGTHSQGGWTSIV